MLIAQPLDIVVKLRINQEKEKLYYGSTAPSGVIVGVGSNISVGSWDKGEDAPLHIGPGNVNPILSKLH